MHDALKAAARGRTTECRARGSCARARRSCSRPSRRRRAAPARSSARCDRPSRTSVRARARASRVRAIPQTPAGSSPRARDAGRCRAASGRSAASEPCGDPRLSEKACEPWTLDYTKPGFVRALCETRFLRRTMYSRRTGTWRSNFSPTQSSPAGSGRTHRRSAADPGRRGLRQDPRHRVTRGASHRRGPRAARRGAGGDLHEQGRRGDARARRAARRRRLPRHLGLDVPLALRAAASPRSAGDRPVARLRHLRLVGSAVRRQAGDEDAEHRRQARAAARRAQPDQPGEEQDGIARGDAHRRAGACAISRSAGSSSSTSERSPRRPRSTSTTCCSRRCRLVEDVPRVREFYARKFKYVLVDEYQDTNRPQYLLDSSSRRGPSQPLRRRRSGSVHLQVARRGPAQHPRLRAGLS